MAAKKWISFLGIIFALLQTGCALPPQKIKLKETFDEIEAKNAIGKGNSTVKGSGLIRQSGGGVVTCAGQTIRLVPATKYARERFRAVFGSEDGGYQPIDKTRTIEWIPSTPESFVKYQRKAVCDPQGFFNIENVSPGQFFVTVDILWNIHREFITITQGGGIAQLITVEPNSKTEIVLSP